MVLHSKNFICCDKRVIHVNFFRAVDWDSRRKKIRRRRHRIVSKCLSRWKGGEWIVLSPNELKKNPEQTSSRQQKKSMCIVCDDKEEGIETEYSKASGILLEQYVELFLNLKKTGKNAY